MLNQATSQRCFNNILTIVMHFVPFTLFSYIDHPPLATGLVSQVSKLIYGTTEEREATAKTLCATPITMNNTAKELINSPVLSNSVKPLILLLTNKTITEGVQEAAIQAIVFLSENAKYADLVIEGGGVTQLIRHLEFGTHNAKGLAAAALWKISYHNDNEVKVANEGAIKPLVKLLETGSNNTAKLYAANALHNLSRNSDNCFKILQEGGFKPHVQLFLGGTNAQSSAARETLDVLSTLKEQQVQLTNEISVLQDETTRLQQLKEQLTLHSLQAQPEKPKQFEEVLCVSAMSHLQAIANKLSQEEAKTIGFECNTLFEDLKAHVEKCSLEFLQDACSVLLTYQRFLPIQHYALILPSNIEKEIQSISVAAEQKSKFATHTELEWKAATIPADIIKRAVDDLRDLSATLNKDLTKWHELKEFIETIHSK